MKKVYLVDRSKCSYNSCGRPCISNCPVTLTNNRIREKKEKGQLKNVSSRPTVKLLPAIDFKNSTNEIIIHSEICVKCGICTKLCPKNAIYVKNIVEEDINQQKIHLYSEDGFRLYNLPTIVPGRVTGLCGPNGIGKSTIMNILALTLIPNLGDYKASQESLNWNNVIENMKDTNLRHHFQETSQGNRKISYKKQVLKILFEEYKGLTVDEILTKHVTVSEKFKNKIFEALDIKVISNRLLDQCSGGELQRFAIALVLLQNADVYLVDEPATFLDVKKRIKLAELLQYRSVGFEETNPKTVLVVEHDLTVLDYMSDVIHLFYGEPHIFGLITRVQSVKAGINSYLNGYLKAENVQFRESQIRFRKSISGRTWSNAHPFAEWGQMTKNLGDSASQFTLNVTPGVIYQNEILGVVGENGLGKTTFFKILNGTLTPETGSCSFSETLSISYKPQYITQDYEGTVGHFIEEYSKKYINDENLLIKIYEPLGIEKLFDHEVKSLSGGQLQRVYIAACLTKDANLYLIDEPSAYLDVEERLKISDVIRTHTKSSNATTICIEHDIQITDALADRLLIFLGEPGRNGYMVGPLNKREGMNVFLKSLDVTFRRDDETGRARINKKNSKLDQQQRSMGEYYYVKTKERVDFADDD